MKHECIIGLILLGGEERLIKKDELLIYIESTNATYNYGKDYYKIINPKYKPYTLKDYCDKRKSTNLIRFNYCPYCGKEIDWKAIKNEL